MCKWESCLKRSRQEEESFSSQFFGGLFVSVVNSQCPSTGSGDAGHRVLLEGTCQRVAGEGGGSGKEKRLAPDLFPHIFSHEALSLPSHHVALPLFEPNGELSAQQGLRGATARCHQGLCSKVSFLSSPEKGGGNPSPRILLVSCLTPRSHRDGGTSGI